MSSTSSVPSYSDLSLCVYVGNTTTVAAEDLLNYSSQFGAIVTSSFGKTKFCDFTVIEFARRDQFERFLRTSYHDLKGIRLEVRPYRDVVMRNEPLALDRKCFVGPIPVQNDIRNVVERYRRLDSALRYALSREDGQDYLLFEFSNRQAIASALQSQGRSGSYERREWNICQPYHPRQLISRIISTRNKTNQIHVHQLTADITSELLIEYFNKRAPVIACQIVSHRVTLAVIEFIDDKAVRRVLETPEVRLQGATLRLNQATQPLLALLPSAMNDAQMDVDSQRRTPVLQPVHSLASAPNQPLPFSRPEPAASPPHSQSGWSSPPRSIVTHRPSMDVLSARASPPPIVVDTAAKPPVCDVDVKPASQLVQFVERFQSELDQINQEYKSKFAKDRALIDQEINLLVGEERRALDTLRRYLNDQRQRGEKRSSQKRKISSSLSSSSD